jgi:glycosyltransferase involved in cell wall biosynthesis
MKNNILTRKFSVCHLTSVHPPFDTRIFFKECSSLAREDYDVVLIAQHNKDEWVNRVYVKSIPYPTNRFDRMTRILAQVFIQAWKQRSEIFHIHDPELIPIGIILKMLGKKVIYDVHEDYPVSFLDVDREWIHPRFKKLISKGVDYIEKIGAYFFDGIVTATPTISSRFPPEKTVVVQNYPLLNEFGSEEIEPYQTRYPYIVYVGSISKQRGIREMVDAIGLIPQFYKARLLLAGSFYPAMLQDEMKRMLEWEHVDFLGWQSRDQISMVLGKAMIGLVTLHPTKNYLLSYPIKLFEYMSVGIPIIASDFPLWREIVETSGCGLLVNPLDTHAIADAIIWLLEHPIEAEEMGKRGQDIVRERCNWDIESKKLLDLYYRILA